MHFRTSYKVSIVTTLAIFSSTGYSQLQSVRESTFNPTAVSVEIKPLPVAVSAAPGVASIGLGTELSAGNHVSSFFNASMIDANLPNSLRNKGNEDNNPQIQKMNGYAADLGVRYYQHRTIADSWYGGGKVGYVFAKGQWGYRGQSISQTVRSITPGLEAGYRWTWGNKLLFRLGAGADGNVVQENTTTPIEGETDTTIAAADKVEGYATVAVVPRFDMGLGYTF